MDADGVADVDGEAVDEAVAFGFGAAFGDPPMNTPNVRPTASPITRTTAPPIVARWRILLRC